MMFDALGDPFPWVGALLSFILLLAAVTAFGMYIFRWVRDYRDETKSAADTQ
jgi:hypothetical protein